MQAALRYYGTFAKIDSAWLFAVPLLPLTGSKNALYLMASGQVSPMSSATADYEHLVVVEAT